MNPSEEIPESSKPEISWIEIMATMRAASVKDMISLLNEKDNVQRRMAAGALVKLGDDATSAIPALIDALNDPDLCTRNNAAWALGIITPLEFKDETLAALKKIEDSDWNVEIAARNAQWKIHERLDIPPRQSKVVQLIKNMRNRVQRFFDDLR